MSPAEAPYIPHGDTALRLSWRFLPPHIRAQVERHLGSPVVDSRSCDAGFTSGFASVLTCADGRRHFVKGAAATAQQGIVAAYREEARVLAGLPPRAPAARLRWVLDEDWFLFSTEFVDGASPRRPWRPADVAATLDACERLAAAGPARSVTATLADSVSDAPALWNHLAPGSVPEDQLAQARALAGRYPEVCEGTTLVHSDLRDDNVLIDTSGAAVFVDWNWAVVGPSWVDSLEALIGPKGDGVDVAPILASRPLLREVPEETIDIWLALMAGYFLGSGSQPAPTNSPHLRDHQWWQGEVCWDWLAERRGWPVDG